MRLADLTWTELARVAAESVLAVPVGSTEQHGPHLPVSTDTDIAVALCCALATARPGVLVAPAVAYGSAGEHSAFPGTLSLGAGVTESMLVELGRSADAFGGVLFVSTHGGNASPVSAAVRLLQSESRRVLAWSPPPADGPERSDSHAGRTETSVMLSLRESSVRADAAEPGCREPLATIMPTLRSSGVRAVSPNGVLGDPAGATALEGERLMSTWVASLIETLEGWE
ncbi:MAG TPA: mycofactocin biosynthesis peptidyl-dipeptidase MftE [Acidimicrobiales bacterium]|nr:mycofactocin biosynthesis peptidyl-dipeptidase MftE [Acidimicrobiales bacterium]